MAAFASSRAERYQSPVADGRPFVILAPDGRPLRTTSTSSAALTRETLSGIGLSTRLGAALPTTSRIHVAPDNSAVGSGGVVATEIGTSSATGSAVIRPITRNTAM